MVRTVRNGGLGQKKVCVLPGHDSEVIGRMPHFFYCGHGLERIICIVLGQLSRLERLQAAG